MLYDKMSFLLFCSFTGEERGHICKVRTVLYESLVINYRTFWERHLSKSAKISEKARSQSLDSEYSLSGLRTFCNGQLQRPGFRVKISTRLEGVSCFDLLPS